MHLFETLGLASRKEYTPAQLSGGEQQRIAIAVALANRPQILLADEPTGEVDTATAAEVYAALRKINQLYGMTVLIVSHDPNLSHYTDREWPFMTEKPAPRGCAPGGRGQRKQTKRSPLPQYPCEKR